MPPVLHAAWAPTEAGEPSPILLWAEADDAPRGDPTAGEDGGRSARAHPFLRPLGALRAELDALGLDGPLQPGGAVLWLPTIEPGAGAAVVGRTAARPMPGAGPAAERARGASLAPWRVVGLTAPMGPAVEWLLRLAETMERSQSEVGADLAFWSAAGRWAIDLVSHGRLVPTVERRADGDRQAVWRPALAGADDRRHLRALAEAMPAAARAWAGSDGAATPAAELLEAFLGAAVDALARGWLGGAAWPEARWVLRQDMPHGAGRWLEALGARPAAARLSARRSGGLGEAVTGWTGSLLGGHGAAFRLCLRLTAPADEGARWRLDYALQTTDDPAVLVSAAAVWAVDGAVGRLAGRRGDEPQELFLAELGRAAPLWPPIAASLAAPRPTGVDLTPEEAYAFLREALPVVEAAGIAVVVPPWWSRRGGRRRLGLKLRLRPAGRNVAAAASGGLGVDALVEYDWRIALGDEEITRDEFERLAAQKAPLVQLRGEWIELPPDEVEGARRFWRQHPADGELSAAQAVRLGLGAEATGLPLTGIEAGGWLADLLGAGPDHLGELPEPPGFVGELRPYQRRGFAWLSFMRAHGLGACLADSMGLGKCLAACSLLFVNGRLAVAEQIWSDFAGAATFDGEGYWSEPSERLIANSIDTSGKIVAAPIHRLYRQRLRGRMRTVRLEDGGSVTITHAHKLLTSTGWTNDLSVGTYVGVPARLVWPGWPGDAELTEFLAWQIAEGYEGIQSSFTITQKDADVLGRLQGIYARLGRRYGFAVNHPALSEHSSGRAYCLRITSQSYQKFLEEQGYVWGRLSREKEIPPFVMQADLDSLRPFLRAYLDAEASVVPSMRSVEISSASATLMHQLSVLLRRFGIWLRISVKRKRATNDSGIYREYSIGVMGGNGMRRFQCEIGFGDARKQALLDELCQLPANTNVEGIPASELVAQTVRTSGLPPSHFGIRSVYLNGTQQLSRASLGRVVAAYDRILSGESEASYRSLKGSKWTAGTLDAYARLDQGTLAATRAQLGEMLDCEVFYCRIKSIEEVDYEGWVYDFEVEGHHNYVAENMLCHNTIQTIALLLHEPAPRPALLVCPTSVLGNWARELARFGPDLRVLVHHGLDRPDEATFAQAAGGHDVVLTTYGLLHRDEARLAAVDWAGAILDEAQNVKNPGARASRAARRLRTDYRIALTGTPVENRLGELWSILEFLNPGFLGSAEAFKRRFALPIEREGDADRADELRRLVGPFILRRLKSDPAIARDLPEKLEMKVYTTLTTEQATLYEAVVQDMLARIGDADGTERRGLILATLTKLKQVCNHPAHFLGDGSPLPNRSGKLARLEEMLEELIEAGDQALVFTQFAEFGGRLRTYLQGRLGREVLYLHGGTAAPDRDRLVDRFQSADGPPVFVLSLRAGGVGLNLTRANHVFHYDRWWNPAVESQATDRAHRIGQTRTVEVHTFITAGTLEERIDALIESKRALAEAVIGAGEAWLTELSTDELRSLLTLRQAVIADA